MAVDIDHYLVSAARRAYRLVPGRTYVIGREAGCEIPLQDVLISRRHCQLEWDEAAGAWQFVDLNSRNGIFVDGVRVQGQVALKDQARLQVGGQVFNYLQVPPGADIGALGRQAPSVDSEATLAPGMNLADLASQGAAFSGEVGPGGVLDLLQFLSQTRKHGRLDLLNAAGILVGSVWVEHGALREAMYRLEQGIPALLTMLHQPVSRFAFHAGEAPPADASITGSSEAVLMEIARQWDESGR
ncbi:MAG: FHA domain-containing protein [Planctomycetota bacterium]